MQSFPAKFALLRKQSTYGPFWQLFQTHKMSSEDVYEIKVPDWERDIYVLSEPLLVQSSSYSRFPLRVKISNGNIRTVFYWHLPFLLSISDEQIPVLDFEYVAWLPRPTHRIPLQSPTEILAIADQYAFRCSHIEPVTNLSSQFERIQVRPPTPPRPSQETVTVPLAIPEYVAELLIENAKKTETTCPITGIPFSEIEKSTVTSCFHIFEASSLEKWLQTKTTCPVCRTTIVNRVTKN